MPQSNCAFAQTNPRTQIRIWTLGSEPSATEWRERLELLPKEISEMVGDDLRVVAANRQVCPTISEISFGNLYSPLREPWGTMRPGPVRGDRVVVQEELLSPIRGSNLQYPEPTADAMGNPLVTASQLFAASLKTDLRPETALPCFQKTRARRQSDA